MGFIPNVPLHLVLRVILIGHNPFNLKRLFNNSQDVGCLWDLPWIVGYMLSIVFIETETTAMMFMDSEIGSSSIEVPPNGIGSELEGRPEILKMDPNPQQPALPLNPHEAPTTPHAPQSMPHAEQEAELAHPAPEAGQVPIEALLEPQWVTDREDLLGDLILEFRGKDGLRPPAPHRLQAIVELFENKFGVENLPAIIEDLQANGRSSPFYKDSLTFYNDLKGVSETTLKNYSNNRVP